MKIAVVDPQDYLFNRLTLLFEKTEFYFIHTLFDKEHDLFPVSEGNSLDNINAYIINLEGEFKIEGVESATRTECKGADLIFWLRLKHNIGKPIIITAFQNLLQILKRKTTYTVLIAEGVYFVDILSDFSIFDKIKEDEKDELTEERIRSYYLAHANNVLELDNIRHEAANWFCLKILYDLYNTANPTNTKKYHESLKLELYNINYLLADFIYKSKKDVLATHFQIEENKNNNVKVNVQNEIETIDENLLIETEKLNKTKEKINKFLRDNNFDAKQEAIFKDNNPFIYSNYSTWKNEVEVINKKITNFIIEKEKKDKELAKFSSQSPNVLLIDDQATNGYFEIYEKILIGSELISENFNENTSLDTLFVTIKESVISKKIDSILLDLNLFPKIDKDKKVNEKSGFIILKKIKENFPWMPLIITTASNKVWTLEKIAESKADAYWIKEGMDNEWTVEESVENYNKIKNLVNSCISVEYKSLKILVELRNYLEDSINCWWECGFWRNGEERNSSTIVIKDFLEKTIEQLQRHCKDFVMNFNYIERYEESKLSLASLCNNLGSLVEAILGYSHEGYSRIKSANIKQTRYFPVEEIFDIRNSASHLSSLLLIDEKKLEYEVELIEKLITTKLEYEKPSSVEFGNTYIAKVTTLDKEDNKISIDIQKPDNESQNGFIQYYTNYKDFIHYENGLQLAVTPTFEPEYFEIQKSQNGFLKKGLNLNLIYFKIKSADKKKGTNYYNAYSLNDELIGSYFRQNSNTVFNIWYVGYIINDIIKKL